MTGGRRPRGRGAGASSLRVVAGEFGGRLIEAPPGQGTRPTAERVRQAMFNALDSLDAVADARTLDAFAGSGALGLEALSRGAGHVTFSEIDRSARSVLEANVAGLGVGERCRVVGSDGSSLVAAGPWDLVLADPPYAFGGWAAFLPAAAAGLAPDGVVVIESDHEPPLPAMLRALRVRRYGGTVVTFAALAGDTP